MGRGLSEDELKALVALEQRQALGYSSSKLSAARQKAEYYYLGLPVGDLSPPEIDGRSSVVSTDVRDTIESMLPQLMVTFCGGDKVAEFEPTKPEDEEKAELATDYINYIFFKKNNGHAISYTWMKDALLQKNGIVKVWWDTRNEEMKEEYRALDQIELSQIMDDPEVEIVEQSTYPDEDDAKQRADALHQMAQQLLQASEGAKQGNPQAVQAVQQMHQQMQQLQAQPATMLFDITCKRKKTQGKICVENVPPEEFLISRAAKNIQDAKFVGHRVERTLSELKSMGYKNLDNIATGDENQSNNLERIQRLSYNDENAYASDEFNESDESQRKVWVVEAYIRCDFDGDGISELRKVTMAGNELLDNEEVDFIPFVSITPVPLPHTFFGLSIADLGMETQKTKTSILRAQLDDLYLTVNGRYFAVEGQVNLDDLLTSRPGGIVRMKQPGMAGDLNQGRGNLGAAVQMMEYMQQDLENRTGWSRMSMGNSAAALNQTATSANIVTNKADMRVDLIARNFSEGFVELFKFILKLCCQYQNKKEMAKVSGQWTEIDPREWRNEFDVTINVGIGMGNKDQKIQHLMALIAQQEKVFPLGVTNPEGIYESSAELSKLLGFKNGERFFSDPATQPPQPPKPDPEAIKAQAEQQKMQGQMQIEQQKMQQEMQLRQMEMQAEMQRHAVELQQSGQAADAEAHREMQMEQFKQSMQAEQVRQQNEIEAQRDIQKAQLDAHIQEQKRMSDAAIEQQRLETERWKIELQEATKITVAQIAAQTASMATAQAAQSADDTVSEDLGQNHIQALHADLSSKHDQLMQMVQGLAQEVVKPKTIERDATGKAVSVNGRPVQRDASGRLIGI